jgi:hypothetical protein
LEQKRNILNYKIEIVIKERELCHKKVIEMIVYEATKDEFLNDVFEDKLVQTKYLRKF